MKSGREKQQLNGFFPDVKNKEKHHSDNRVHLCAFITALMSHRFFLVRENSFLSKVTQITKNFNIKPHACVTEFEVAM
ncbi:CLUMA_CG021511, isoform A [Clunio marinus]|uniref:CLUMA_CG021511, isoform A n=1 Tax=Clunio marinus TaxID=568069 RepID=A0A1J1J7C1_9DIPT|nr:CLUMA_CG021511, isoform A [Clunio marinus]